MAAKHHTGISEKELDNLLGQAFLNLDFNDTKNEKIMEAIASQHLIHATSFGGLIKKIFLNSFVFVAIGTGLTIGLAELCFDREEEFRQVETFTGTGDTKTNVQHKTGTLQHSEPAPVFTPGPGNQDNPVSAGSVMVITDQEDTDIADPISHDEPKKLQYNDHSYIFPVLTEEEIKTNNKQKKKMIAALVKMNKDKYAYIPPGTADYHNKTISVKAFYMQTTEVSNLEYRTFLHDLLVQGRKDDYRLAMPDNSMWMDRFPQASNEPMAELYFWHSAYDDYPVVNVSREGAELYCKWLTAEANKILGQDGKPMTMLRLPGENEWVYAAMGGKSRMRYANAGTFLRNQTGAYEVNYMGYPIEACRYDSIVRIYLPANSKYSFFEDGGYYTVTTTSYFPNPYGIYCMAGNVSEMITTNDNKASTKGGSWFSCDYFLEIEAEDEHRGETGPSPMIGFRPVVPMWVD